MLSLLARQHRYEDEYLPQLCMPSKYGLSIIVSAVHALYELGLYTISSLLLKAVVTRSPLGLPVLHPSGLAIPCMWPGLPECSSML